MQRFQTLTSLGIALQHHVKSFNTLRGSNKLLYGYVGQDWKDVIRRETNFQYYKHPVIQNKDLGLYVISWGPRYKLEMHDHPENGCAFKILQGTFREVQWKPQISEFITNEYSAGNRVYIDNMIGHHSMENLSTDCSVSLHAYSPGDYQPTFWTDRKTVFSGRF